MVMRHGKELVGSLLLWLLCALPAAPATQGFKVITSPANPVSSLSRDQLARLFLKKTLFWPNGAKVVAVEQPEASPARTAFSRSVLQKSMAELAAYWQQQIFTGKAVPPTELANDAQIVRFVTGNALGIGYVTDNAEVDGAKVLRITD
jgi:hypothetical protein